MSEAYDLGKMLEEIIEDEKISISKNRKISQDEIRRLLAERLKSAASGKDSSRLPLGEALVHEGLIGRDQLQAALKAQAQKGGKIGSVLVELGYVTDEDLLRFLGKQHGLQGANLLNLEISESLMSILPSRLMFKHRILPLKVEGNTLSLAMENPNDFAAMHEVEFLAGKRVTPVIIPSYQMDLALKYIEEKGARGFSGMEMQNAMKNPATIHAALEQLISMNGSDLIITAGVPPTHRVNGILKRSHMPVLNHDQCVAYAKNLMTERQWEDFLRKKEIDFALDYEDLGRFRINAYRQKNSVSLALRRVRNVIPSLDSLGLPHWFEEILTRPQGLILVAGPAGQGKTTTIAVMVDLLNRTRACNIITLEDPTEFVHRSRKATINQRELGTDTDSFSESLRRIFRQSPDVVVIGEIRDTETMEIAFQAACGGILVLSSMHAPSATGAIEAMVSRYPSNSQSQIRQQLAEALLLIFVQRLLPSKGGDSLVLAYEKLFNSVRIKTFIRENKLHHLRSQTAAESDDFAPFEASLLRLLKEGKITVETALTYIDNPEIIIKSGIT